MASTSPTPTSESESSDEIAMIRATYPNRCRVTCDVGQYKSVITLQPENMDATIKFHLTPAYPSVIPDIKIRSESLSSGSIQELEEHLQSHAKELIGKAMIQSLMEEAREKFRAHGMRPGKVKSVDTESFLDGKSKSKAKKNKSKQRKSKSKCENEEEYEKKLPSMKTAEDVINRIMWDDNLDADLFLVGYIDRFRGLLEKYFTAFSWEDIATVDYDVLAVPKHRIQYFKYKDVKIWDKTKRVDNVFGSANGTKTIDVVMKEVEEKEQNPGENSLENGASALSISRLSSEDSEDDSDSDDDDGINVTISSSVNIGTTNDVNEDTIRHGGEDQYWTDKLRPNYFICVRITDQRIIDNIGNVQDSLLQREPILAECCIPGASLHLTLSMLGLDTSSQLLNCMEAMKKMKTDLQSVLPKSTLKLKGISNFYGRVAYAKVSHEKDFKDFCDELKLQLREAGVQIRDGYEFVPHVTIVKVTRPVSRARGSKNINPKYYEQFSNMEFGEQSITSICLCAVGDERRPDGFYLTPLELHLD